MPLGWLGEEFLILIDVGAEVADGIGRILGFAILGMGDPKRRVSRLPGLDVEAFREGQIGVNTY